MAMIVSIKEEMKQKLKQEATEMKTSVSKIVKALIKLYFEDSNIKERVKQIVATSV